MSTVAWIIVLVIAAAVGYVIAVFNTLVRGRNRVQEAWSDIDVQLKRRYNLIPNLVESVKAYAKHEQTAFESVTTARARALGAQTPADHAAAENMLTASLKSLFAVAEAYPDLKADTNWLELQRELSDTENKIQAARRFYNTAVRDFNTAVQSFPSNIIAGLFSFKPAEYFELADEAEKSVPKVNFQN